MQARTFFLGCAGASAEEAASSERGASVSLGRSRDCEGEAGASGCRAGAGGAAAGRPMWPHLLPSVSSSLRPLLSGRHASPPESLLAGIWAL